MHSIQITRRDVKMAENRIVETGRYSDPSLQQAQDTIKKKQRQLIIPNIIVIIMAAVTIICAVLMPMFKITVHIDGDGVMAIYDEFVSEDDTVSGETEDELRDVLSQAVTSLDVSITMSLYPLDVVKTATGQQELSTLIAGMIGDVSAIIDDIIAQILPELTDTVVEYVESYLNELYEDYDVEISEETTQSVKDVLNNLSNNDTEAAKEEFANLVEYLETDLANISGEEIVLDEETKQMVLDIFNDSVDGATDADGNFSYSEFISLLATAVEEQTGVDINEYLSGDAGSNANTASLAMPAAAKAEDSTATDTSDMQEIIDLLTNFDLEETVNEYLAEIVTEENEDIINIAMIAVVAATVGITAFVWLVLFLFALFHTLSKNRRFTTWYVKLFAWIPGVLLWLAPTVAIALLPSLITEQTVTVLLSAITLSFGGSGIVCLVTYALLWLISIFWLFPIKHRIRSCKKFIKTHNG